MFTLLASLFSGIRTYIYIGIAVAVFVAMAYFYFSWSQGKISALEQIKAQQEIQIAAFQKTIETIKADAAASVINQNKLNFSLSDIRTSTEKEKAVLDNVKFDAQAEKDVVALEKKLNAATAKTLKKFEDLTK